MQNLQIQVMSNSLIAIFDDKIITLMSSDPRYGNILKILATGFDEVAIKNILLYEEKIPNDRIKIDKDKDKIVIDSIEMPDCITMKYLELKRRHKSYKYLLNFWDNLQKNPNKKSIDMLYTFLNHNGHPIMSDGSFIAYKAVRQDLLDHYSRTNEHKINKIIRMDRDTVNENPEETCSTGLHVASWKYIKENYTNSRFFEVLVQPKDVVSVPVDYDGTKMRVCAYKVYREVKDQRDENKTTQLKALQNKVEKRLRSNKY